MSNLTTPELATELNIFEHNIFTPYACFSNDAIRREKTRPDMRQEFSIDADRILHSLAYTRYIDKTQVFYLLDNDHITHRVLHVQFVSKIARTIGKLLGLNCDLIEAIALGHDLGHPPFGHDGERILSEICEKYYIGPFRHNIQSVRALDILEKGGKGCNLTLQVLDGIFCHDGELHTDYLEPDKDKKTFGDLYNQINAKKLDPSKDYKPMTLEGCVVRIVDTISYIGRDIEDAILLGILKREDIPSECSEVLGNTNGRIIYNLVDDLVYNSLGNPFICFSEKVGNALKILKAFNRKHIYLNPKIKHQKYQISIMYKLLFDRYLDDIEHRNTSSEIFTKFLNDMSSEEYIYQPQVMVCDFIAGMTDDYFLKMSRKHFIPEIRIL